MATESSDKPLIKRLRDKTPPLHPLMDQAADALEVANDKLARAEKRTESMIHNMETDLKVNPHVAGAIGPYLSMSKELRKIVLAEPSEFCGIWYTTELQCNRPKGHKGACGNVVESRCAQCKMPKDAHAYEGHDGHGLINDHDYEPSKANEPCTCQVGPPCRMHRPEPTISPAPSATRGRLEQARREMESQPQIGEPTVESQALWQVARAIYAAADAIIEAAREMEP